MLHVMVTQVTKYDEGMIPVIGWSYISQSQVTQSYNTKKIIKRF